MFQFESSSKVHIKKAIVNTIIFFDIEINNATVESFYDDFRE